VNVDTVREERTIEGLQVVDSAKAYVVRHSLQSGGWKDFRTSSSGASSSWVTAHILRCLSGTLPRDTVLAAENALISEKDSSGGWGFSEQTPPDCDSTLNVVYGLRLSADHLSGDKSVWEFLSAHQMSDGGFATYRPEFGIVQYRGLRCEEEAIGWCMSHVCVTAFALRLLALLDESRNLVSLERAIAYLIEKQALDGYWESYWWRTKYYATAHAMLGLKMLGLGSCTKAINRALDWIVSSRSSLGWWDNGIDLNHPCPLSTALAVGVLIGYESHQLIVSESIEWLLNTQRRDGSWKSEAILQIPPPDCTSPATYQSWRLGGRGVGSCSADPNRLFTTALVAAVVQRYFAEV